MMDKERLSHSWLLTFVMGGICALAPFSTDTYLPVLPAIAKSFDTDIISVNLTITAYFIGMAIGQLLGGPISDQLGRKPICLFGLALFICSTFSILMAPNIEIVQVLRLLQASGGGLASVVCMAQVRDIFPKNEVGKRYSNIMLVMLLAPMIAPILGVLIGSLGWNYIFIFLGIYAFVFLLVYLYRIPETNEKLYLNNITVTKKFSVRKLFQSTGKAFLHRTDNRRVALRYVMFNAFSAGTFMSYLTNASFVFIELFRLSELNFAILFSVNAMMLILGNRIARSMMNRAPLYSIVRWANISQILILLALLLLTHCIGQSIVLTNIGFALILVCGGTISPSISGLFIGLFKENIGSAASFNATAMFLFGGVIGGLASVFSNGHLIPIVTVMLISSSIAGLILLSARVERV